MSSYSDVDHSKNEGAGGVRVALKILRWLSDEALQTYARDGEQMYAKWLHAASGAHISTVQVSNLLDLSFSCFWGMWMVSLILTTKMVMMMMMMQKGCEVL